VHPQRSSRTVVVGGGLLGLATAQALLERGEPVTVIEARNDVALETSYGNAGIQTPSQGDPWNSPGVHWHLASSLFDPRSPMKLRLREIPSLTSWGLRFLRNSARGPYLAATEANFHLGRHSVDETRRLAAKLKIEYDAADRGTMKVFRDRAAMQAPLELARRLSALGLKVSELDTAGAVQQEPLLADICEHVAGALYFPDDASGDSLKFCRGLRASLAGAGVEVLTSVRAKRLLAADGVVQGVLTNRGEMPARRVVVACGVWSARLLESASVPLSVKPAKGYSLTIDLAEVPERPRIPVLDDAMHVAVTPLGNRLRIGGTAEFAGFDQALNDVRVENLARVVKAIYPRLADRVNLGKAEAWTGLRPMSCDGRAFIGPCGPRGLYVNAGHGHLGWTQAAGSGHLLADLMTGREPAIDAAPFRIQR
jgi:D-amino-acid dehydrogenase